MSIYSENFTIVEKKKNFDNVTRIFANSSHGEHLELDVHDIFLSMLDNDKFSLSLSNSFSDADYITNGIVLKSEANELIISYNGLLMYLKHPSIYKKLEIDHKISCYINC